MARNRLRKRKWFVANQRARKAGPLHELPVAAPRSELWVCASRARCAHAPGVRRLASARARGRTAVFGRTVGCPLLAGACAAPSWPPLPCSFKIPLCSFGSWPAPEYRRRAIRSRPEAAGAGPRVRGGRASGKPRVYGCTCVPTRPSVRARLGAHTRAVSRRVCARRQYPRGGRWVQPGDAERVGVDTACRTPAASRRPAAP